MSDRTPMPWRGSARIAWALALVLVGGPLAAAEEHAMSTAEITLSGPQARAIAVAHAEFQKTAYLVEHYEVIVATHDDAFEVIFLPAAAPGRSTRGGETPAGKEIHYWVARRDYALLRTTYAR